MLFSPASYLSLPSKPGVYEFLDKNATVLYVGKAIDLKTRVSSYFNESQLGEKTRLLVSQTHKIRITIVESELEALLLEAYFIKKNKPRFNIRLTDNKAYILVKITLSDTYPKVLLARSMENKKEIYFGPFPNSSSVKLVLKTIRKVFPYQSVRNHPKRICLYNHIGLCPCPPVFDSPEFKRNYRKNIRGLIRVFQGETRKIIHEFEKQRDNFSKYEEFEQAAFIQKNIDSLHYITQPFRNPVEYALNPNLRSDIRNEELESLKIILTENGCMVKSLTKIECYDISNIQGTNATGSLVVFSEGEKNSTLYRKFKIRRENKPNDYVMMEEVLRRRLKHTEWEYPGLIIVDGGKGQVSMVLHVLHENNIQIPLIGLAKKEETIVIPVLENSKFESRNSRQIRKYNDKNSKRLKHSNLEHLGIVSDFGFRASDLRFTEVSLPKDAKALHLIMRIRDEAHRFAVSYHRELRSKSVIIK